MFYKLKNKKILKKLSGALTVLMWTALSTVIVAAIAFSTAESEVMPLPTTTLVSTNYEVPEQTEPLKVVEKIFIDTPITFPDIGYSVFYDIDLSSEFLSKVQTSINELEININTEDYTEAAKTTMIQELSRLQDVADKVESDISHYVTWENEYYYATKVWEYFMQRGYGEVVTSAILGNMMIETSGGTLNINPNIYSPGGSYYGLCQWSVCYYPGVAGLPFEHQLDYLIGDMPYQFNTFGGCYKYGFDYEDFLAMTDPAEAAYAFAKVYERCAAWSCDLRRSPAVQAYNYFKLDN